MELASELDTTEPPEKSTSTKKGARLFALFVWPWPCAGLLEWVELVANVGALQSQSVSLGHVSEKRCQEHLF